MKYLREFEEKQEHASIKTQNQNTDTWEKRVDEKTRKRVFKEFQLMSSEKFKMT